MAGIGFELRKLLKKDSLLGLVQAYAYAGVIGSGPWVLSIVGILAVGLLASTLRTPTGGVVAFQVSVTWLIARLVNSRVVNSNGRFWPARWCRTPIST